MGRLLLHAVILALSVGGTTAVVGRGLEAQPAWRDAQDPRARLLWDGRYDGSTLVLIGDSEFCSFYVDTPDQTLWGRLAALTGERVFPGALNGAKPDDLLLASDLVASQWPAGTIVFVDVPPTRFAPTNAEEPPIGNYPEAFLSQHGLRRTEGGVLDSGEAAFYRYVMPWFPLVRQREYLGNLIDRPAYFKRGIHRNRVWSGDPTFARDRFTLLERNVTLGAPPRSFEWLAELVTRLHDAKLEPVLVFTPVNEALIDAYASQPGAMQAYLRRLRQAATGFARALPAPILDVSAEVDATCFADLVHTNACGDDAIARRMAAYVQNRRARTAR